LASATLAELRAVTYKKRDSWWTVLLVDPLAIHLVRLADRLRWVTPNRITLLAFVLGFGVAGCFLAADPVWLVTGAVLYHVAFILDCVDGKLARWQKSGSVIGGWLDFTLDQVRLVMCAIALLGGQYLATGRGVFLLMAAIIVFLNMFRYFNGFLMERALFDLRERLTPSAGGQRRAPSISDDDQDDQDEAIPAAVAAGDDDAGPALSPTADRSPVGRLRVWLTSRRIRLNVYSGIEFQMVVLIGAPLVGAAAGGVVGGAAAIGSAVLAVTIAACTIMVGFELAQTARFLRSARQLLRAIGAMSGEDVTDALGGEVPVQRPASATEASRTRR
jgi:phosphatidylglycerophosphate synthase